MYKGIKAVILFSLLASLLVQPVSAAPKTTKIKVTFVSAQLVEKNHVGNEWYTKASVNGKEVGEGETVTLSLASSDSIKLKAYAEERDSIPDVGTANSSIKVSSVTKAVNKSLKVEVVENRGRYSGNTAEWKFTFKIQK